ncbi:hypothetical protein [Streptomyces sp. NPDC013740]|uniref:hypothetical protein n=1 Tax=Streptomyces sp. NPDC013740 TaxID=3364867 RepID=UPI0036FB2CA2
MVDAELIELATAAGTAVVQAAGTDAWNSFRDRVARLFGRGSAEEASAAVVLERLDRTAAEVVDTELGGSVRDQVLVWRTRFLDLLEGADGLGRDAVAAGLRELVASVKQADGGVSAVGEGVAVGGDLRIEARDHSVAAVRMGNVTIENPSAPGAEVS